MRTWSDIWDYLRGDRTGKAANRLEREALSDPFLYEALEGLTRIDADHEHIVCHLQQKLRQRNHFRRWRYPYWIAASLVILGGIALLWESPLVPEVEELVVARAVMDTLTIKSENREKIIAGSEVQKRVIEKTQAKKNSVFRASTVSPEVSPEKFPEVSEEEKSQGSKYTMMASDKFADTIKQTTEEVGQPEEESRVVPERVKKVTRNNEIVITGPVVKSVKSSRKARRFIQVDWQESFKRYVADSLRYPVDARQRNLEGEVILSVRMNRKGHPARIKIVKSLSPSCDLEAVRLVESYPGLLGGAEKKVILSVFFRLKNGID